MAATPAPLVSAVLSSGDPDLISQVASCKLRAIRSGRSSMDGRMEHVKLQVASCERSDPVEAAWDDGRMEQAKWQIASCKLRARI